MRASAIIVATLATFAAAHSSAEHSGDHTSESAPTATTGGDPVAESNAAKVKDCMDKCDASDVNCLARCVGVPSPNDDQANDNIECARNCDQGDGSEADTIAFGNCLLKCRGEHYFSEGVGTPNPTGSSNNGSGDSSDDDSASATGTGSGSQQTGSPTEEESGSESGSSSGTAGSSEETGSGSGATALSALTSVSLFGFVAAFFL